MTCHRQDLTKQDETGTIIAALSLSLHWAWFCSLPLPCLLRLAVLFRITYSGRLRPLPFPCIATGCVRTSHGDTSEGRIVPKVHFSPAFIYPFCLVLSCVVVSSLVLCCCPVLFYLVVPCFYPPIQSIAFKLRCSSATSSCYHLSFQCLLLFSVLLGMHYFCSQCF
jgi:hypothetical protein